MPQVTITYKNPKTLEALKDFLKDFDIVISKPKEKPAKKKETFLINGVTMIRGGNSVDNINNAEMNEIFTRSNFDAKDPSVDISGLHEIFTGKNIDAKELRRKAWRRKG